MILLKLKNRSNFISNIADFGIERISQTCFIVFEDFGILNLVDILDANYEIFDIKRIICCLVKAAQTAHESGIIHRDIKLSNVIINDIKEAQLIDWGLADFLENKGNFNVRVSTKPFKAPELLVEFQSYDESLDMWGIGNVLACLVCLLAPEKKAYYNG